jgi:hypothetical protein
MALATPAQLHSPPLSSPLFSDLGRRQAQAVQQRLEPILVPLERLFFDSLGIIYFV